MPGSITQRWRRGVVTGGLAGLALIATAAPAAAAAVPAPTPRVVQGNVTTCAQAGLSGSILFSDENPNPAAGSGTESADQLFLTVTINSGFTASGIAVKGGPDTNVYDGPFVGPITIENLRAPQNPGGQQPEISDWFVCGTTSSPKPSVTPSGAPETGGGGSYGVTFAGLGALALASAAGIVLFRIRRRNDAAQ
jgi:LPXTG-motif cell wall-anchored protein